MFGDSEVSLVNGAQPDEITISIPQESNEKKILITAVNGDYASSERTAYTWLPDTRIEFCSPYSRRKSSNSTVYESD
ncbi:unnamed protein product [Parnassius mnemosyne]|uniref:Uncharacterized protein n=1 Tax=Parnassius mnemosyne TaxID=213953 RepID=A0AAV1KR78_9NEOP